MLSWAILKFSSWLLILNLERERERERGFAKSWYLHTKQTCLANNSVIALKFHLVPLWEDIFAGGFCCLRLWLYPNLLYWFASSCLVWSWYPCNHIFFFLIQGDGSSEKEVEVASHGIMFLVNFVRRARWACRHLCAPRQSWSAGNMQKQSTPNLLLLLVFYVHLIHALP